MYRINEIFYSLQGEGYWTGTPAVFLRFSGCNLKCPFCDTDFAAAAAMTEDELISALKDASSECKRVIVTGGEPALQLDEALVQRLHKEGYTIHIETNGTRALPEGIDSDFINTTCYDYGFQIAATIERSAFNMSRRG